MADRLTITLDARQGVLDALNPAHLDWWLPTLGPTATHLLPRLVRMAVNRCNHSPDGLAAVVEAPLEGLAYQLGVAPKSLIHAVDRLHKFRCAQVVGLEVCVRRWLTHVPPSNVERAPEWWRAAYATATGWVAREPVSA